MSERVLCHSAEGAVRTVTEGAGQRLPARCPGAFVSRHDLHKRDLVARACIVWAEDDDE